MPNFPYSTQIIFRWCVKKETGNIKVCFIKNYCRDRYSKLTHITMVNEGLLKKPWFFSQISGLQCGYTELEFPRVVPGHLQF